jgi:peroxiredoxin
MSQDSAPTRSAVPLAPSLAQFTERLIERRGVERANVLFDGQINPATKALRTRTDVVAVGDKAPHFSLPTADGGMWSLEESLRQGVDDSLVLVFYRGTWCTYCNLYLRGLLEVQSALYNANAALIAVSPEAAPTSASDVSADVAKFPILIDHGSKVADKFGLIFEMDDAAKNELKSSGLDLEKRNADGRWTLPVPGTFVIDGSGRIAYAHIDPDYRTRPEPREIVAICQLLRRQLVSHRRGGWND